MLAVELYFPELRGKEGWAKHVPPVAKEVISEPLAYGIAVALHRKGRANMATAVLTAFECYLRAADIQNAKCKHFIFLDPPQGPNCEYHGVLSLPKTKRGINGSVYIRGKLIAELLRRQERISSDFGQNKDNRLFQFTLPAIRKQLKAVLEWFGMSLHNTALHGLRYGGATTYDMHERLSRDEIQQRGRWASAKSMRQYLQPDRAHAQLENVLENIRDELQRRLAQRYELLNFTPPPDASGGGKNPSRGFANQT